MNASPHDSSGQRRGCSQATLAGGGQNRGLQRAHHHLWELRPLLWRCSWTKPETCQGETTQTLLQLPIGSGITLTQTGSLWDLMFNILIAEGQHWSNCAGSPRVVGAKIGNAAARPQTPGGHQADRNSHTLCSLWKSTTPCQKGTRGTITERKLV